MKIFKSILSKITIAIILTVCISISIIALISSQKIEQAFSSFLDKQTTEIYGLGYGRNQNSEEKALKHEQLITDFQNSINQSILIASTSGIIGSIIVGIILSRQISNPIKRLNHQLKKLSKNNFESIDIKTNTNELNELISSYNELITELKRIETLREDLVSDVTHELKTPLTKVIGQLEGCIDGVYKCDNEKLKQILGNTKQLEALISGLQELVEIKAGKIRLNVEQIHLMEFIENIISGYSTQEVKILNKIQSTIIVLADLIKLREILDNLISNAIRHTKEGNISIEFEEGTLLVKDTGEGIAPEDLPYIFERFYRSDKSRSKQTGGLGLGLSIVKELVTLHKWIITVDSMVNKGTTFKIKKLQEVTKLP